MFFKFEGADPMTPTLQAAALLCLLGAPAAMAQGSYRYGPDEKGVSDAVVSDTKSSLIWRRCSEARAGTMAVVAATPAS